MDEEDDCSFISENLYLSGIRTATNKAKVLELGVTHLITADIVPLVPQPMANYVHIAAADHWEEDLISFFPAINQFIDSALQSKDTNTSKSVVLVHCVAGCSRSVTLVMAYLMYKNRMTFRDALVYMVSKRPMVDPNTGFREQLALWESMNYQLDISNRCYRQILLKNLRYKLKKVNYIPFSGASNITSAQQTNAVAQRPVEEKEEAIKKHKQEHIGKYFNKLRAGDSQHEAINNSNSYKCKKCRLFLFKEINVLLNTNEASIGPSGGLVAAGDIGLCEAIFVEPLEWMMPAIADQADSGIINCPHCMLKLGGFDWSSLKCYTSEMKECPRHKGIAPAFKLDTRKIDCHPH